LRREVTEAFLKFSSVGEVRKRIVPVITIDKFVKEKNIEKLDLVKIDTEGTEPQVLKGMADVIERDRPILICEVLKGFETEKHLEDLLGPLGYRYYLLTPDGPALRNGIEGQPDSQWDLRNYLFATTSPDEVARL
jgi:methyltransferase, FkbM family